MATVDEVYEAIAAGDLARAEELANSITEPDKLTYLSSFFASAGQQVWAEEIFNRGHALRRGATPLLFRFFEKGEQPRD